MPESKPRADRMAAAKLSLSRDSFMRTLIRHLAGTLEEVVGMEEAAGFISVVGQKMGEAIDRDYRDALGLARLSREQVADVLVDLKRRIAGDFWIIEEGPRFILLGNRACPFGDRVIGRPSMCMMTSNVFGCITAQSLGYAKVELRETIAEGHRGCVIGVHLDPQAAEDVEGREYFGTS